MRLGMACVLLAYVGLDLFGHYEGIMLGRYRWQNHVLSAAKRRRFVVIGVITSTALIMPLNVLHVEQSLVLEISIGRLSVQSAPSISKSAQNVF